MSSNLVGPSRQNKIVKISVVNLYFVFSLDQITKCRYMAAQNTCIKKIRTKPLGQTCVKLKNPSQHSRGGTIDAQIFLCQAFPPARLRYA